MPSQPKPCAVLRKDDSPAFSLLDDDTMQSPGGGLRPRRFLRRRRERRSRARSAAAPWRSPEETSGRAGVPPRHAPRPRGERGARLGVVPLRPRGRPSSQPRDEDGRERVSALPAAISGRAGAAKSHRASRRLHCHLSENLSLLVRNHHAESHARDRVARRVLELVQAAGKEMVGPGDHEKRPAARGGDLAGARGGAELVVSALNPRDVCVLGDDAFGLVPVRRNSDEEQHLGRETLGGPQGAERPEREAREDEGAVRLPGSQPASGRDDVFRLARAAVVRPRGRAHAPEIGSAGPRARIARTGGARCDARPSCASFPRAGDAGARRAPPRPEPPASAGEPPAGPRDPESRAKRASRGPRPASKRR